MDLFSLLFVTAAVLGVLLLVLAVIAVVVLLPPVRRAMRERANDLAASESEADVESAVAESEAPNSDGAEPAQR